MRHGIPDDDFLEELVGDSIGEAGQEKTPDSKSLRKPRPERPSLRSFQDQSKGALQFGEEVSTKPLLANLVPERGLLGFDVSVRVGAE